MMAKRSETCRFNTKKACRWWQVILSEASLHSFIHSVTKQMAVVMNGLLITDSPNRSKLQIPSLTKHSCCLETHTSSVADFVGNIIISL